MSSAHTVILHNGGLRSLVATAMVRAELGKQRLTLLHLVTGQASASARLEHVRKQAQHFAVDEVVEWPLAGVDHDAAGAAPMARPQMLLHAAGQAIRLQAQRLIYPAQVNGDFPSSARISEQVLLVQNLAELEWPRSTASAGQASVAAPAGGAATPALVDSGFDLQTPLLELTDRQVIELGGQLEAPWALAWSCELAREKACRSCTGCRRRRLAFDSAAILDSAEQVLVGQ